MISIVLKAATKSYIHFHVMTCYSTDREQRFVEPVEKLWIVNCAGISDKGKPWTDIVYYMSLFPMK